MKWPHLSVLKKRCTLKFHLHNFKKNLSAKLFRPNVFDFLRIILRQIFQIKQEIKRIILSISVLIVRDISDIVQVNIIINIIWKGTGGNIG